MGDRGNAWIQFENGQTVYLYTHWNGSELMGTLARGLKRAKDSGRMDDESYAARIIFQEWTKGIEDEDTGAGIAPWFASDAQHPIPTVRFMTQDVAFDPDSNKPGEAVVMTVDEFIEKYLPK